MREFRERLLEKYNILINELEIIDSEYHAFLNEANSNGNISELDMAICMAFAKENHRRLQFAIAERETLN